MAKGPRTKVPFRRRREGKTDYRDRIRLIRGGRARAVVRRTNREIRLQFISYDAKGDRVIAHASARDLRQLGWTHSLTSTPVAYLVGLLGAHRASAAGLDSAVLDIGLVRPSSGARAFAVAKGIVDGGLDLPLGTDIVPDEPRIQGQHLGVEATFATVVDKIKGGGA